MPTRQVPEVAIPLTVLIEEAQVFLRQQNYNKSTDRFIRSTWRSFLGYAPDGARFSTELARQFVKDSYGFPYDDDLHPVPDRIRQRLHAMRLLVDYAIYGRWSRHCKTTTRSLGPENEAVLAAFSEDWYRRELSARALRPCMFRLRQFLLFLEDVGLTCSQIDPGTISAFVSTQLEFRQRTVEMITYYLRTFLRFLYLRSYVPVDWSGDVPRVRVVAKRRIPSVWRREDVERLLNTVDRGSPVGKRDYAILLLVAKLGLRVGDIRELQLEHFDWKSRQLVFPQAKTGQVASLPLLEDIGWAVIDYLQHGRPITEAREVFVQHKAPFAPFAPNNNLYTMINHYRQLAGIPLPTEQRHGLHSLRHTLASSLLEAQTPLSTIAAILGHLDSGSTKVYLKVDLNQLRQCALDPEEVCVAAS